MAKSVPLVPLFWLASSAAMACGTVEQTEPGFNQTVTGPLNKVVLHFSEPIDPNLSKVEVLNSAGQNQAEKLVATKPTSTLSVPTAQLKPGAYTVKWKVRWADCHETMPGDYTFKISKITL